jgi:major vault protein
MSEQRGKELVLTPNESAYVLDKTKGQISIYVGPHSTGLTQTDDLVVFDERTKRFVSVDMEDAKSVFKTAPANWYIVLKNPASKNNEHPCEGLTKGAPDLTVGKKIIIHGPTTFALWPGQMAKVIQGHTLKSNQYLVVRIYDAEMSNGAKSEVFGGHIPEEYQEKNLEAGQKIVIKGTDVSFYMPPSGAEVVPDNNGEYIRNAVTLQRLEYCILISEDGEKYYLRGEDVVFPRPNQEFVTKDGKRKFLAIELSETTGIYVKVIAPYKDGDEERKEGEELFLTGKDKIYFPRAEHAIVKYGDHDLHYAVAIPQGEGRYVLNRLTSEVRLVRGPRMLLPDPRNEVITQRILSDRECFLMYPGNDEALSYNRNLRGAIASTIEVGAGPAGVMGAEYISNFTKGRACKSSARTMESYGLSEAICEDAMTGWGGDEFSRKKEHTKPRTITLDTKYEGAVSINVWSGFALLIVNKDGGRRVVIGPKNGVLLDYDETVESLHLSTGKPKSTNRVIDTAFLKVSNNYVSDQIGVITRDGVMAQIEVKYLVEFSESENSEKWFAVDNYVKLLTDRCRSMVKTIARKTSLSDLEQNVAEIIRDTVLGRQAKDGRKGLHFKENGLSIQDVDVLYFKITNKEVSDILFKMQTEVAKATIQASQQESELGTQRRVEAVQRELDKERHRTSLVRFGIDEEATKFRHELDILRAELAAERNSAVLRHRIDAEKAEHLIVVDGLETQRLVHEAKMVERRDIQAIDLANLKAQIEAVVAQAGAFSPEMTAALNRLGDVQLLSSLADNFSEIAAVEGKGILKMAEKFLDFNTIRAVLPSVKDETSNQ